MPKSTLKAGPAVPGWVAVVVIVAIIAIAVGAFMYTSTPRGPAPERPGGPPSGMATGAGGPPPGLAGGPGTNIQGNAGRPGGPPAGMMGGPGGSGAGGRPSAPAGMVPGR